MSYRDAWTYLRANPEATSHELAQAIGCRPSTAGGWRRIFREGRHPDFHERLQAVRRGRAEPSQYAAVTDAVRRMQQAFRAGDKAACREAALDTQRELAAVKGSRASNSPETSETDNH